MVCLRLLQLLEMMEQPSPSDHMYGAKSSASTKSSSNVDEVSTLPHMQCDDNITCVTNLLTQPNLIQPSPTWPNPT